MQVAPTHVGNQYFGLHFFLVFEKSSLRYNQQVSLLHSTKNLNTLRCPEKNAKMCFPFAHTLLLLAETLSCTTVDLYRLCAALTPAPYVLQGVQDGGIDDNDDGDDDDSSENTAVAKQACPSRSCAPRGEKLEVMMEKRVAAQTARHKAQSKLVSSFTVVIWRRERRGGVPRCLSAPL